MRGKSSSRYKLEQITEKIEKNNDLIPVSYTHLDVYKRQLHNYFFMKSVDMVREGGLVAFITSQGVLNAEQGRPCLLYTSRCV